MYVIVFLGKAILHTTSAMILHWGDDESNVTTSLIQHRIVTIDEREQLSRLIITFVIEDQSKVNIFLCTRKANRSHMSI